MDKYDDTFKIVRVREHYEVYYNGKFFCSADTPMEAAKEIEKARAVYYSAM